MSFLWFLYLSSCDRILKAHYFIPISFLVWFFVHIVLKILGFFASIVFLIHQSVRGVDQKNTYIPCFNVCFACNCIMFFTVFFISWSILNALLHFLHLPHECNRPWGQQLVLLYNPCNYYPISTMHNNVP